MESIISNMRARMSTCRYMDSGPFHDFTVVLHPDDNGTFVAYVPAISGCHAWGRTPEEAQSELVNVFEMIKEEYIEEGKPLPNDIDLKASQEVTTGTLRDLWGEEIAWRMGIRNFLDNNSTMSEECMRGRWRG